jgi:ribosome biogenesis GTPase
VVLACVGGRYRVLVAGRLVDAVLRGRMKHRRTDVVLVGDRVTLANLEDAPAAIEAILPRRSVLKRRSPGRARGERIVAANVDHVVVVGAARMPDWDPYLIDRFLAVAEANDLSVTIVINKADLDAGAADYGAPYAAAGYPVLLTSAVSGAGVAALRGVLEGHVTLFSGPTGVGKSSLLNALVPGIQLRTGAVSPHTHGGRHTTVSAEMHPFGTSGFVVDTPGLRDVGLWGISALDVARAFPDVNAMAGRCRFDNCQHRDEPGCAVRTAAESGTLAGSRYRSYRKMLDEADSASRPWGRTP